MCIRDSRQHDYITAAVSHLPHVIASSLVNLVRDSDSADGLMKLIAAGGFKDITRIASSSTVMWPVSYTHLDVYKRQGFLYRISAFRPIIS